jgi:hypothetical protein
MDQLSMDSRVRLEIGVVLLFKQLLGSDFGLQNCDEVEKTFTASPGRENLQ